MNRLYILLSFLNKDEQKALTTKIKKQDNLVSRFILHLIAKRSCTEKQMLSALGITTGLFNKVCSQVKNVLLEELKRNVQTPVDEVYVIQKVILAGELVLAQKMIVKLENEFEEKQLWVQLEVLYVEASRIYYANGDLDRALNLTIKREKNAERLSKYIQLNSNLVNEMIRLEGFMNRKPGHDYYSSLKKLKEQAFRIGHHVLIHNALHLDYLFTSRFEKSPKLVHSIILEMLKNAKKFESVMNPLSHAIIKNTHLNFLTIYTGFGNPGDHVKAVSKVIDHAGTIARANMSYAMLEYYLYEERFEKVLDWLSELEKIEDNSKFRQYKHIIFAIKAFTESDYPSFKKHFSEFYSDVSHLDFPDMEMCLRILELLVLFDKNEELVGAKITSLKKYMSRNINKDRYHEERKIVLLIEKIMYDRSVKTLNLLDQFSTSYYRSTVFLAQSAKKRLSKNRD